MLPHWLWRVRFRTIDGGGETLVVAPHRAGAKKAIGTSPDDVTAYESADPRERIADNVAAQRFDGYYPSVRKVISAGRTVIHNMRQ